MEIEVISSGSQGNCTVLKARGKQIVVDAGIKFEELQKSLKFKNPTACLITHEHRDHAHLPTIRELLARGVPVFMTPGTAQALKLDHHNLHHIEVYKQYLASGTAFGAIAAKHDAAEPVNFIISQRPDTILYVIDTGTFDPAYLEISKRNVRYTKVIIETNYSDLLINETSDSEGLKWRIRKNHLSISQAINLLKEINLSKCKEIHLVHISKRNGDAALFRQHVSNHFPAIKVIAH